MFSYYLAQPGCRGLKWAGEQSSITDKQCLNPSKTQSAGRRCCPQCHFKKGHVTHSHKSGWLKLGLIELPGKVFLVPWESKLFLRMIISDLGWLYDPARGNFFGCRAPDIKTHHIKQHRDARSTIKNQNKQISWYLKWDLFQRLMVPRKSWTWPNLKHSEAPTFVKSGYRTLDQACTCCGLLLLLLFFLVLF